MDKPKVNMVVPFGKLATGRDIIELVRKSATYTSPVSIYFHEEQCRENGKVLHRIGQKSRYPSAEFLIMVSIDGRHYTDIVDPDRKYSSLQIVSHPIEASQGSVEEAPKSFFYAAEFLRKKLERNMNR